MADTTHRLGARASGNTVKAISRGYSERCEDFGVILFMFGSGKFDARQDCTKLKEILLCACHAILYIQF